MELSKSIGIYQNKPLSKWPKRLIQNIDQKGYTASEYLSEQRVNKLMGKIKAFNNSKFKVMPSLMNMAGLSVMGGLSAGKSAVLAYAKQQEKEIYQKAVQQQEDEFNMRCSVADQLTQFKRFAAEAAQVKLEPNLAVLPRISVDFNVNQKQYNFSFHNEIEKWVFPRL
jgi:hypothetical protein